MGEDFKWGHLLRDGKLKPSSVRVIDKMHSVIIVGGGCSGLAAGWSLHRNNVKDFVILEMASQLGGTAQSGSRDGLEFPWGAHYVETPPREAGYLFPLYEDLGIIMGYYDNGWPIINSEFTVRDPEVMMYTGKNWIPSRYPHSLASKEDSNAYQTFRHKMYQYFHTFGSDGKKVFTLPIQATSQDSTFRKLDQITMKQYLEMENLSYPLLEWYVDMQCRDNFGARIDEISAWVAINYFATNFTSYRSEEEKKHPVDVISWVEGNQYLVRGMRKHFSQDNVKNNALVVDIKNNGNHVLITYFDTNDEKFYALKGKSAIIALPKFQLPLICKEFQLKKELLKAFQYAPWIVANIHVKHPPRGKPLAWDNISYSNWSLGYIYNSYLNMRLRNKESQPSVITFYAPLLQNGIENERKNLLMKGWDYWANRVVNDIKLMHPNISSLIERIDIVKWGHAMIRPTPNFVWGREREEMVKPINRIHFAHSDVGGLPIFEQAFYSGEQAVKNILKSKDFFS